MTGKKSYRPRVVALNTSPQFVDTSPSRSILGPSPASSRTSLKTMREKLTLSQKEEGDARGDEMLNDLAEENTTKSGFRNSHLAQEYHKLTEGAKRACRDVIVKVGRFRDRLQFHHQPGTSSEAENTYRTAGSLYRCWLSCKDAFPSPHKQDQWVMDAWNQACLKTGTSLHFDKGFKCSSMNLLTDMKTKTKPAVESSYEFDTSPAQSNADRAQALLDKTTFIYQESDFGGRRLHPYQHPIIQDIINISWFKNKDDIGIVFHEHFNPIPFEVIALAATVIEYCIDECFAGTCNESSWKEVRYKTKYFSHLNLLRDLDARSPHQESKDLLRRIQDDLLRAARIHAGVIPELNN